MVYSQNGRVRNLVLHVWNAEATITQARGNTRCLRFATDMAGRKKSLHSQTKMALKKKNKSQNLKNIWRESCELTNTIKGIIPDSSAYESTLWAQQCWLCIDSFEPLPNYLIELDLLGAQALPSTWAYPKRILQSSGTIEMAQGPGPVTALCG